MPKMKLSVKTNLDLKGVFQNWFKSIIVFVLILLLLFTVLFEVIIFELIPLKF